MKKVIITAIIAGALGTWSLSAADAQSNWDKNCAKCHGKDGSGKTAMGKKFKLLDYTQADAQASFTDEQAAKAIKDGVEEDGKTKMKPYGDALSEQEINDLVALVRSFKK